MELSIKQLRGKLSAFNQARLSRGELVLLASVIAKRIRLMGQEDVNDKLFVISNRELIDTVTVTLGEFCTITEEDHTVLLEMVSGFAKWRKAVADGTNTVLFSGDGNVVIDELSSLPQYVSMGNLCSLAETASSNQWKSALFGDVVECAKVLVAANREG